MAAKSAGILMYRRSGDGLAVLLVHPGGPFWRGKDLGAWSIPKGEYRDDETPEAVASREFFEELGTPLIGTLHPLGQVVQKAGKTVAAFAVEGDFDVSAATSNEFTIEWPPKSGRMQSFPEVDRAEWFPMAVARDKLLAAQRPFLDRLEAMSSGRRVSEAPTGKL